MCRSTKVRQRNMQHTNTIFHVFSFSPQNISIFYISLVSIVSQIVWYDIIINDYMTPQNDTNISMRYALYTRTMRTYLFLRFGSVKFGAQFVCMTKKLLANRQTHHMSHICVCIHNPITGSNKWSMCFLQINNLYV